MIKFPDTKKLTHFVSNVTSVSNKTLQSEMVKKTISVAGTSSKKVSSFTHIASGKVMEGGKKIVKSEKTQKAISYLGASSKEVISESRKIASTVVFNVSIVAFLFFSVNTIFIIYGIWIVLTNFAFLNLLLMLGLIIGGLAFSFLAAYRCYKYAQFKIGLGIYHLFAAFFKSLIKTSISEIENHGSEKMKKMKIQQLLKKNGNAQLQSSNFKVPGIIRKPIMILFEFIPFGDIIVEIIEESKRKAAGNIEDQVMNRVDTFVSTLTLQKKFTNFIVMILIVNIIVMSCLVNWM